MEKVQRNLPYWVIAVVMLVVVFFAYVLFAVLLGYKPDTVREVLQSDGRRIQASLDRDGSHKVAVKFVPLLEEVPVKVEIIKPEIVKQESPKKRKPRQADAPAVPKVVVTAPAETKPEVKPEVKPVAKQEVKTEAKPEVKPKLVPQYWDFNLCLTIKKVKEII